MKKMQLFDRIFPIVSKAKAATADIHWALAFQHLASVTLLAPSQNCAITSSPISQVRKLGPRKLKDKDAASGHPE